MVDEGGREGGWEGEGGRGREGGTERGREGGREGGGEKPQTVLERRLDPNPACRDDEST